MTEAAVESLSQADKHEVLTAAAVRSGCPTVFLEKDIWVVQAPILTLDTITIRALAERPRILRCPYAAARGIVPTKDDSNDTTKRTNS